MSPRPTIGDLRQRVTIEAPVDAPDDIGGFVRTYATLAQVWALVERRGAGEQFIEQRLEQSARFAVTIRWRVDVTSQMRIIFRGRKLSIESVEDLDGRRRFLLCMCEEIS
ncbi:phage head closure protein [Methylocystis parvus]|uniref:Phage head closure protein n=1 Tax=Methylocystis parvus TaxID=134 RepID=A0A6B8M214_9HYPH|nr:phage head closure protein [Methylocystis parvus]QGM96322.1 phage head closure protein [Methylocystis parvus]WBJ99839.1 phage head closure protein [Methylocystis parvus OBBP]